MGSPSNGVYVFVDAITKYEVQSSLNGTYADTAVPSAPTVTEQSEAWTNKTSLYAVAALEAKETTTTGSTVRETYTYTIPVGDNVIGAAETTLATYEGVAISISSLSKTFNKGDVNGSTTVTTVADLIAYVNGDTTWGSDITVTASSGGAFRSNQTINYTFGDGSAGSGSVTGSDTALWYKLGSTHISGTITLTDDFDAAEIAAAVAADISATTNTAEAYEYGAAYVTGGKIALTKRVSIAGYPDDVSPGVTSMPTISFVIDAAQTSTTAVLAGTGGISNVASQDKIGWTSGFFLNVTKNDVPGMTVKLVNNNVGVSKLGTTTLSATIATGVTQAVASGIMGVVGYSAASRSTYPYWNTKDTSGYENATSLVFALTSDTHFIGPNTSYTNVFADVSTATTSTSQAAAITNRSGWL